VYAHHMAGLDARLTLHGNFHVLVMLNRGSRAQNSGVVSTDVTLTCVSATLRNAIFVVCVSQRQRCQTFTPVSIF
jgi:hypothetical protein